VRRYFNKTGVQTIMARILFAWELGGGMGHIAPYLPLLNSLRKKGHQVAFALRNLEFADLTLGNSGIPYFQAPVMLDKARDEISRPHNLAQILHNVGYGDVNLLTGLAKAWQQLFAHYRPDIIVFDYSPTAQLAARTLPCRKVVIGSGFFLPPNLSPLPLLRKQPSPALSAVHRDEQRILANINTVLHRLGSTPITRLAQLYDVDEQVLSSFRELDHYVERQKDMAVQYWGPLGKSGMGQPPRWPEGKGKRIYAYLKNFKTLPALLRSLQQLQTPTLIYAPEVPQHIKHKFACNTLHFSEQPLDLDKTASSCDLAIAHATHGTCTTFLLAGKPLLLLPLYLEQRLVSDNIVRLGAGVAAPQLHPEGMGKKLHELLANPGYGEAARAFAGKYAGFDADKMEQLLLERILGLVANSTI
jgi:UDP:flavonoid glycosyltransferase YjiC (YdhE family)